ncbi:MAG: ParA family protein [Planctomycetes bacterium]|nr:ParA family protein [Planctomycetota bacterium]
MHVLSFVNQKGGCGKTTAAVNLAGALAAKGRRVLLVDLDPQAHATMALGWAAEDEPTVREVLLGEARADAALVSGPGGVSLLPASAALADFEDATARMLHAEGALRAALEPLDARFDEVLLDCPPRVDGVLCANALRASDTAVLVVETGAFALQGAVKALDVLAELRETLDRPFDLRVLGTLFDRRTRFARELLMALHGRFGEALFDTVVRTSVRLREAAAMGVPVQVLDPACRGAADFEALAGEWLADGAGGDGAARDAGASRSPAFQTTRP